MSTDSMREWPIDLRLSAAVDDLGKEIWRHRCEVWGQSAAWDDLPPMTRQIYRDTALIALQRHKPEKPQPTQERSPLFQFAVDVTKAHAKLIGIITPETKFGEPK